MASPEERLKAFQAGNHISTRGPLSFVVQFTRLAENRGFPDGRKGADCRIGRRDLDKPGRAACFLCDVDRIDFVMIKTYVDILIGGGFDFFLLLCPR